MDTRLPAARLPARLHRSITMLLSLVAMAVTLWVAAGVAAAATDTSTIVADPTPAAPTPSISSAAVVATSMTLSAAPTNLRYGAATTLTAGLTRERTTTPLAGKTVRFEARTVGTTTWSTAGSATTSSKGVATLTTTPRASTEYRAVFAGSSDAFASKSGRRSVTVQTKVTVSASASSIRLGKTVTFRGTVSPKHAGQPVRVQWRRSDGTWKTLQTATLAPDSTYRFVLKPTTGGSKKFRVVKPADADHATGTSSTVAVTVRAYVFPVSPAKVASYGHAHHDYPATDIFAPCGTTVVAATAGVIDEISLKDRWDPAVNAGSTRGGLFVSIVGTDGVRYYGSHLQSVADGIRPGVKVATGQVLGTVGRTGSARPTPCHLHFGISPPCGHGDWQVRRGVLPTWPYLDAWKAGTDRSPAREVQQRRVANSRLCPGSS